MWKKEENDKPAPARATRPSPSVEQLRERAIIGPSIRINGELSGDEDLLIHGQVEGKINLPSNNITVGRNGRIKADVFGKIISIEGEVQGNLFADEKIIIRQSGTVRGNISAPRVTLEDGSRFKGSIDMEAKPSVQPSLPQAGSAPRSPKKPAESPKARDLKLGVQAGVGKA